MLGQVKKTAEQSDSFLDPSALLFDFVLALSLLPCDSWIRLRLAPRGGERTRRPLLGWVLFTLYSF